MEDHRTAQHLLRPNEYMVSLDLKDAYFLISVHKNYRKYLRFKFQEKLFEFNVMPFGLSIAPYVFTKLLKPILQHLRNKNIRIVAYLDDLLIISKTKKECLKNLQMTQKLLEKLVINLSLMLKNIN